MTARAAFLLGALALAGGAPLARAAAQAGTAPAGAPVTVALRGRVLDAAARAPLEGAEVTVTAAGGARVATLRTGADGAFRVERAPAGELTVQVRRLGYLARAVTIRPGGDEARELEVALTPAALRLDQVVVTASRRAQRLKDVAVTTELVSRDDIARTGATDLASVLTEQVGVQLQGGTPAGAGVMLQGLGSQQVLVLLDGQPMVGRVGGHFDISRIPAGVVERVEVVKGPQSTLYGSDAMGGVINIVTRTPATSSVSGLATVTAGNLGRLDGAGRLAWGSERVALSADAGRRSVSIAPGVSSASGTTAERTDGAFKARITADSARWLEASALLLDERQRWRLTRFYEFGDNRQVSGRVGGSWARGRHRVTPTVSGSGYEHTYYSSELSRPIAGDTGQRQVQRLVEADLLYNLAFARASSLDLGVEARHEDARSPRVPGGRRVMRQVEPFAQAELALGRVSVVPGVRVTANDIWGTRTTPRVALRWSATDELTVRLGAGAGFRAPSFNELYLNFPNLTFGYALYGNERLRPESSRNYTAGAELSRGRWYARATGYWNDLRDFIQARPYDDPSVPLALRYENVSRGRTRGTDVEAGLSLPRVTLDAGYGWLDARDLAAGRRMLGRAPHSGRVAATLALPWSVSASVTGIVTGATPMAADDATGALAWRDRFARTDVRVARRVPGGLELVVGADNLFDVQPERWAGFAGRHVYTSFTWSFDRNRPAR